MIHPDVLGDDGNNVLRMAAIMDRTEIVTMLTAAYGYVLMIDRRWILVITNSIIKKLIYYKNGIVKAMAGTRVVVVVTRRFTDVFKITDDDLCEGTIPGIVNRYTYDSSYMLVDTGMNRNDDYVILVMRAIDDDDDEEFIVQMLECAHVVPCCYTMEYMGCSDLPFPSEVVQGLMFPRLRYPGSLQECYFCWYPHRNKWIIANIGLPMSDMDCEEDIAREMKQEFGSAMRRVTFNDGYPAILSRDMRIAYVFGDNVQFVNSFIYQGINAALR
jgi:hypothetical protein